MSMASTADSDFGHRAAPFRRELLAHCYRMLGGIDEAEDLVQEAYLRAWRAYGQFEGRSSLRTWLYTIATNVCLTALDGRRRRPLPAGLGDASNGADAELRAGQPGMRWIEPIPDDLLAEPSDPATLVVSRDSLRLAHRRAAVPTGSSAGRADPAGRLGLARRRGREAARHDTGCGEEQPAARPGPARAGRAGTGRGRRASGRGPPGAAQPIRDGVRERRHHQVDAAPDRRRGARDAALRDLVPRRGRPGVPGRRRPGRTRSDAARPARGERTAVAVYARDPDSVHRAHALHVLTVTASGISRIVAFLDVDLFGRFGLPSVHSGIDAAMSAPN